MTHLAERLQIIRFEQLERGDHLDLEVKIKCSDDTSPACLQTQVAALSAIHWHEDIAPYTPCEPDEEPIVHVSFSGLSLTREVMKALQGLPAWVAHLQLWCEWPLKASEYKQLAQYIPVSYTHWELSSSVSRKQVEAICAGINVRREGLGMPLVCVSVYGGEWEEPMGEHAFLTSSN